MTQDQAQAGTALVRGTGSTHDVPAGGPAAQAPPPSIVPTEPAAAGTAGGTAAGSATGGLWPGWAQQQLLLAAHLGRQAPEGANIATTLYRDWFSARVAETPRLRAPRPLAGVYRAAHAGTRVRRTVEGVLVLARHDVVAADGWWRTWGESWTPTRARPSSVRVVLTPDPAQLGAFVRTVTGALLDSPLPWLLSCATDPRRTRRTGAAVLHLPEVAALPDGLLDALRPLLLPFAPPLCDPLVPGAAVAVPPTNGMTFGEHRCHLIATALRHPCSDLDPLRAVAAVFAAHGIDPSTPWRSR